MFFCLKTQQKWKRIYLFCLVILKQSNYIKHTLFCTMKIIHTSDWHLGHILYGYSREDEHRAMIQQMVNMVREHQPDAFVLSGDVYDNGQPSASVQKMLQDALLDLHHACPTMQIVCIAGNHDSGTKHEVFSAPWKELNVSMLGTISKDVGLEPYIIEVPGKGWIVAVPYTAQRFMPDDVYQRLYRLVAERNPQALPVVLMAHLAVEKSDWRGHELSDDTNIGGLDCQSVSDFGTDYDYVALGHIHKNQSLDKDGRICYCGTPIPLSFDEVYSGNEHGVMLVECSGHGQPVSKQMLQIEPLWPLVNLPICNTEAQKDDPDAGFADWQTVKHELKDFDREQRVYIRLNVLVDNYLEPGANGEAENICKDKACRFCRPINARRRTLSSEQRDAAATKQFTTSEFRQLDATEVAAMYFQREGLTFTTEMKSLFEQVLTE